jgi:hypothetical protein
MLVSDFIDTTTVSWNTELLQQYFLYMDIEIIKAIPLSTRRMSEWAAYCPIDVPAIGAHKGALGGLAGGQGGKL